MSSVHFTGRRVTQLLILCALLLCSACAPRPTSLTVPLELRPTDVSGSALTVPTKPLKVYVGPVEDNRAVKDKIGENREEPAAVPIYAAGPAPAQWVRDSVITEFRQDGLNVVDDESAADRKILISLVNFWAEESPDYKAHISVTVQVQDSSGKVLWSGTAFGDGTNFGRSLSRENYQEVLSNALVQLTNRLIAHPGFSQAVTSD
jgi:hypothetical protein